MLLHDLFGWKGLDRHFDTLNFDMHYTIQGATGQTEWIGVNRFFDTLNFKLSYNTGCYTDLFSWNGVDRLLETLNFNMYQVGCVWP